MKKYTDTEIEVEARKYTTINDFAKNSPNYYSLAKRRNLMVKFREFLKYKNISWTDKMLRDESLKYTKKKEFQTNSMSAYVISKQRGIYEDITSHMDQIKKWSYDEAKEESKKYKNKQDFKKSKAYRQSFTNGWLNDFFVNSVISWTKEMAHEEAKKYNTRVEFKKGSPKAYSRASYHKWMDDITKHMHSLGNLYERMVYVYEFSDNHVYVGLTDNKKRRHKEHTNDKRITPVSKHINETGLNPKYKEESSYIFAEEAQKLEQSTIDRYRNDGWIILNTNKAGGLGKYKQTELTMEIIRDMASNFTTRADFKRSHKNEYQLAQRYGWLQDVLRDIPIQDRIKWTYERTKEYTKQFNTRSELKSTNQSAYHSALKNKWLDEFFPTNLRKKQRVYDQNNDIYYGSIIDASIATGMVNTTLLYQLTKSKNNNTGLILV
jgi:hypothetical protein